MLIWKEELPFDTVDIRMIKLPFASTEDGVKHVLKIDTQYGLPVMWFQADDDSDGKVKKKKDFVIQALGTGHEYTEDCYRGVFSRDHYIGTVSLAGDSLILHYFLVTAKDYEKMLKREGD